MVWQPPRPAARRAATAADAKNRAENRAKPDWGRCCTLTLALDRAERGSNKLLTLTAG
jgi:hypothetical protein